jgi:hypothetical protein
VRVNSNTEDLNGTAREPLDNILQNAIIIRHFRGRIPAETRRLLIGKIEEKGKE